MNNHFNYDHFDLTSLVKTGVMASAAIKAYKDLLKA